MTKDRICSECGKKEDDNTSIFSILLPPTITRRKDVCDPCLRIIVDNDIRKNKAK
jgi:hypothetical protein